MVAVVRLGKKRFMGQATAFDVILGIMLGSLASRAITGNAPLGPTLAAASALLAMHWAFSALAVRWHRFGVFGQVGRAHRPLVGPTLADENDGAALDRHAEPGRSGRAHV